MELACIATGLTALGTFLQNKRSTRMPSRTSIPDPDPVGSNEVPKAQALERELVHRQFEKSKRPKETNVIPYFYNTLHTVSKTEEHLKKVVNPSYNPSAYKAFVNRIVKEHNIDITPATTEIEHFDDLNPPHLNMQPFFGAKVMQSAIDDDRNKMTKLSDFTGQYHTGEGHEPKREMEALFNPSTGAEQTPAALLQEPRDMERYNPNNTGKKSNELPFVQIRVGPAIGAGPTAAPQGGYHSMYRPELKGLTELKVNPVLEREGRIIQGSAMIKKRGLKPNLSVHRTHALIDNNKFEYTFKTTGAVQKSAPKPQTILKDTNRRTCTTQVLGPAHAQSSKAHVRASAQESHKKETEADSAHNIVAYVKRFFRTNVKARFTERSITDKRHIEGAINPTMKRGHISLSSLARQTKKQTLTDCAQIVNPQTFHKKGRTRATDNARTTLRQLIAELKRDGNVAPAHNRKSTRRTLDKARTTNLETTEDKYHQGWLNGDKIAGPTTNPNEKARTTNLETTEDKYHQGWLNGDKIAGPTTNPNEKARTTQRETIEHFTHSGHAQGTKKTRTRTKQPTRTTHRQTTEQNTHTGPADVPVKRSIARTKQSARTTHRQTTEQNTHTGPADVPVKRSIARTKQSARTTHRQDTEDHARPQGNVDVAEPTGYKLLVDHAKVKNTNRQFTTMNSHTGGASAQTAHAPTAARRAKVRTPSKNRTPITRRPTTVGMSQQVTTTQRGKTRAPCRVQLNRSPIRTDDVKFRADLSMCAVTTSSNRTLMSESCLDRILPPR